MQIAHNFKQCWQVIGPKAAQLSYTAWTGWREALLICCNWWSNLLDVA